MMKTAKVGFLSTVFAAIFVDTFLLAQLSYDFTLAPSQPNLRLLATVFVLAVAANIVSSALSVFFFVFDLFRRLRSRHFDRYFVVNLLLIPMPLVYLFAYLPQALSSIPRLVLVILHGNIDPLL